MDVIARIPTPVRKALFAGNSHEDPICGHRAGRFAPGPRKRPNARCPACLSSERHRALWLYLRGTLPIAPIRLLHVAPEQGLADKLRERANIDYVSTDLMNPQAMVRADLTDLPFDDGSFDIVVCNHVLEHIPDDIAAMCELCRVLSLGGRAVMQHPIDASRPSTYEDWTITSPQDRLEAFWQEDHVRIYGADFEDRLRAAGFSGVEKVNMREQLSPAEIRRYGILQYPSSMPERDIEADVIYVCAKATPRP